MVAKVPRDGKTAYQLQLGYFDSERAAEQARQQLLSRFPKARVVDLTPPRPAAPAQTAEPRVAPAPSAPQPSSPQPTAPAPAVPAPAPAPAAPPAPVAAAEVEQRAAALLAKGRAALAADDYPAAIETFNELLFLPPNKSSQEAQELIGVARERNGEAAKAKAEYELYLKLYPDGEGAKRVRERLAGLQKARPAAASSREGAVRKTQILRTINGSFSQYYYDGTTRAQTAFNTPTTVDRSTLATKDLSSLVTNLDLTARYRTDAADARLVVRDTYAYSFLDTSDTDNNLSAAYLDYRGLRTPLYVRAGRQSGTSGGVSGQFDGVLVGYAFAPKWRVNVVGGMPQDYDIDSTRYFYGLSVEADGLGERWTGGLYALNQIVDGVTDRRPVGAELRYFDPFRTAYSLFEYDLWFNQVNIAMFQGTWQTRGQTAFNVLYDYRRAPPLATTNSVIGQPTTSISTLLQTQSLSQLQQRAAAVTAEVTQVLASVTTPVGASWQLGADFRLTNVGALPAVGDIPATPATGNIYGYTAQAIGNNLYSKRDINVFAVTLLTAQTYDGVYFAYNNLTALNGLWTIEPSLKLYFQQDTMDVTLRRVTPGLRLTYRLREGVALEGEYLYEMAHTESALQQDDSTHQFFYVGYRVVF
jgi:tetratricopeptide (TPR) repeat protein